MLPCVSTESMVLTGMGAASAALTKSSAMAGKCILLVGGAEVMVGCKDVLMKDSTECVE